MARYRIVCTEQEPKDKPHEVAHIVAVGVGNNPDGADNRMTLQQVLDAIKNGDTFYTKGVSSQKEAEVKRYDCGTCGRTTIRSSADAVTDNNLDKIRSCNWKS